MCFVGFSISSCFSCRMPRETRGAPSITLPPHTTALHPRRPSCVLHVLGGWMAAGNCSAVTLSTGWSWEFYAWRGSSTESGEHRLRGRGGGGLLVLV